MIPRVSWTFPLRFRKLPRNGKISPSWSYMPLKLTINTHP